MAKKKIIYKTVSHGIYKDWDRDSKDLPTIKRFSETVPARVGIEFGYIVNIRNGRGKKLSYSIEHPPFLDEDGLVSPPFTGELYVRTNDWDFFLGDSIWEPVADKIGDWRLVIVVEGITIEDRTFTIVAEETC